MKNILAITLLISLFTFSSCDVLIKTGTALLENDLPLTTTEVAKGLKEALRVGVDTAIVQLNQTDGYYLNPLLKIGLPPETDQIVMYAKKIPGIDKMIENLIVQINRSAEDAASMAAPVFKDAILSMSIDDAWKILNGSDSAATLYLKQQTNSKLLDLYQPIMKASLDKPIVANVSATNSWKEITEKWNKFANSFAGKLLEMKSIDTELDRFVTQKALDGVFYKVEKQEQEIRTNVNARTNDLLKRVFGKK